MQVPVIVTDAGGSHGVVVDGEVGGFVVRGGDSGAIADHLLRLFGDEELRLRLGVTGRRYVHEVLDCRVTADEVSRIYNRLLRERDDANSKPTAGDRPRTKRIALSAFKAMPATYLVRISVAGGLIAACSHSLAATDTPSGAQDGPVFGASVIVSGGFQGTLYYLKRGTEKLPDLSAESRHVAGKIWTKELNIVPQHWRGGFGSINHRDQWFALSYSTKVWVEKPGRYDFALLSDDGSKLIVDGLLVVNNDCLHAPDVRTGSVDLGRGTHEITVPYFQGLRDCVALLLAIAPHGAPWKVFNVDDYAPPNDSPDADAKGRAQLVSDPEFPLQLKVSDFLSALTAADPREAAVIANAPPSAGCVMNPRHYCGK
jgi:PA14 domain